MDEPVLANPGVQKVIVILALILVIIVIVLY